MIKQYIANRMIRRLLLVLISLAIGYGLTWLIVIFVLGTTVSEYAWGPEQPYPLPYFFLTGLSIALGLAVWLDKVLDTEILPH